MNMKGLSVLLLLIGLPASAQVIDGPTLTMNPSGLTPLAGVVELETATPTTAELTITGGGDMKVVSFPQMQTTHYLPVLGLKPDTGYSVEVVLNPGGLAGNLMAVTPPLPADFPLISATTNPAMMEPGYQYFDCFSRGQGDARPDYAFVLNSSGDVVWYSPAFCPISAARQLADGNLFYRYGALARSTDFLLNVKLSVQTQINTGLHHDLIRTPHGTFISLDRDSAIVENYPTSTTDPNAPTATETVSNDSVVEFLPDGTLRRVWYPLDMLEPTRIGYFSLRNIATGKDWSHENAVSYDPADDSIMVSLRHQECVIKFSRATGDLIWILGNHFNWPVELQPFLLAPINSPFRWQYAQHAQMLTGNGTLLLFDNGNNRAMPFDGTTAVPDQDNFSRAVEYSIDEQNMEVEQVWEFGENLTDRIYSRFISDADWQPITGNVVVHFGGVSYVGGVSSADLGLGTNHARILEVTHDTPATVVADFTIYDPTSTVTIYRSERIPDLYPQNYIQAPNGIGSTLRLAKIGGQAELSWAASVVDAGHDTAEYYMIYGSTTASTGFSIADSVADLGLPAPDLQFFKVVAANLGGTSGDEP